MNIFLLIVVIVVFLFIFILKGMFDGLKKIKKERKLRVLKNGKSIHFKKENSVVGVYRKYLFIEYFLQFIIFVPIALTPVFLFFRSEDGYFTSYGLLMMFLFPAAAFGPVMLFSSLFVFVLRKIFHPHTDFKNYDLFAAKLNIAFAKKKTNLSNIQNAEVLRQKNFVNFFAYLTTLFYILFLIISLFLYFQRI